MKRNDLGVFFSGPLTFTAVYGLTRACDSLNAFWFGLGSAAVIALREHQQKQQQERCAPAWRLSSRCPFDGKSDPLIHSHGLLRRAGQNSRRGDAEIGE